MKFTQISPIDGSVYDGDELHGLDDVNTALSLAKKSSWKNTTLNERKKFVSQMSEHLIKDSEQIGVEIAKQMGRPKNQAKGEVLGFKERSDYMVEKATEELKDIKVDSQDGFDLFMTKEPLGTVAILSPWNYPFLTVSNVLAAALLAGNTVILKHSLQTPLVAERIKSATEAAGFPAGAFQVLHLSHEDTAVLIADNKINGVYFTGSVEGGRKIQQALTEKFIPCGLELGGKDPAYVMADADVAFAVENLVDGSFFNSGQSCCGVERIYIHENVYDEFVEKFVALTKQYILGNPLDEKVNLGPMVKTAAADFVRKQIKDAVLKGAKSLVDESLFPMSKEGSPYLSPHVLIDVDHTMDLMTYESFGPVVGLMKVSSDDEAIKLMNHSDLGLTASVWTTNPNIIREMGKKIETGTVFANRCDFLNPALAWTGVKNTGRGVSLSVLGFSQVTQIKSYHIKTKC